MQVTEFEEGGLAIGLSCTQLLADMVSATHFIKAWADITIRGKMMHPPIFHRFSTPQRSRLGDQRNSEFINHYYYYKVGKGKDLMMWDCHTKYSTISLAFRDSMVRSCISTAAWDGPDPSPFEALSGLIWSAVSRVREGLVGLTIGLDMRKVLGLDRAYFGNCMVYANILEGAREEEKTRLTAAAAKAIGEVIKSKMNRKGIIDWMEGNVDSNTTKLHHLLGLNLEHIYDDYPVSSFGEALEGPICARYYVNSFCEKGSFLILPNMHGDGPLSRVVMLTLPQHDLFKICKDDLILSFTPTIGMGENENII